MLDREQRDRYENDAQQYVMELYSKLGVTDWTIPDDPYCEWDMCATMEGKPVYMENKTRTGKYNYKYIVKNGALLAAKKNDGHNYLFNIILPEDNIILVTNARYLEDLTPTATKVKRKTTCDPESKSGIIYNYNIPIDRFWVYQTDPYELISRPKEIRK